MVPGKYNMICPQGATFSQRLTWTIADDPVDLSGYSARMQVRDKHKGSCLILDLSTNNGQISLDDEGNIDLLVDAETTEEIVPREYVYDLELNSGQEIYRLVEGKFIVTPEVTRA